MGSLAGGTSSQETQKVQDNGDPTFMNGLAKYSQKLLYFAYGSNLSTKQMSYRCPRSSPRCLARLPGWRWIINERGYANVVPIDSTPSSPSGNPRLSRPGTPHPSRNGRKGTNGTATSPSGTSSAARNKSYEDSVYGLIYFLHPDDEEALDICEGSGLFYQRMFLDVHISTSTGTGADSKNSSGEPVVYKTLVYADLKDVQPSKSGPANGYASRVDRGIEDAVTNYGLPLWYINQSLRPFVLDPNTDKVKKLSSSEHAEI